MRTCAGIQQTRSCVARRSHRTARRCAEEPAIVCTRTKRVTVLLGWQRCVPGARSAGPSTDDRHADIVPVVDHDAAVGVDGVGRLSGEVAEHRGIAGSGRVVYIDVLGVRIDPNPVPYIAASSTI